MAYETVISEVAAEAACDAIVDLVDADSPTPGYLEILTNADAVLATFTLADPAFGAAAGAGVPVKAVAAALGLPLTVTPVANGTADHFVVYDGNAVEIWRGSCGVTGGAGFDMELDSTTIATTTDITLNTFNFRLPTETTCP